MSVGRGYQCVLCPLACAQQPCWVLASAKAGNGALKSGHYQPPCSGGFRRPSSCGKNFRFRTCRLCYVSRAPSACPLGTKSLSLDHDWPFPWAPCAGPSGSVSRSLGHLVSENGAVHSSNHCRELGHPVAGTRAPLGVNSGTQCREFGQPVTGTRAPCAGLSGTQCRALGHPVPGTRAPIAGHSGTKCRSLGH